jgi:hypothetical protein
MIRQLAGGKIRKDGRNRDIFMTVVADLKVTYEVNFMKS